MLAWRIKIQIYKYHFFGFKEKVRILQQFTVFGLFFRARSQITFHDIHSLPIVWVCKLANHYVNFHPIWSESILSFRTCDLNTVNCEYSTISGPGHVRPPWLSGINWAESRHWLCLMWAEVWVMIKPSLNNTVRDRNSGILLINIKGQTLSQHRKH